ncbi:ankyrin repeat domain-containing protein [Sphingomonas sp. PP-CE-3G-477]|uniref:ankyrin repeat domain-containing protein n=1 Tax=Sphingomonas sp. PP-CE-3G-477 TaxID=2135660 RepID=UPI000D36089B|nr:ankyrin repeat domain-containing protein [Sphingomonas sp. PP-CE-3G-477]
MLRLLSNTTLVGFALLAACSNKDDAVNKAAIMPMLGAVMHSETEEVLRLAKQGIGLDEREPADQSTPMIVASGSDQWPVVEILVDHGANIWAHDQFGITMAQMAVTSRILPGSNEDKARLRVIEKLKARGYPFPPPGRAEILALEKDGKWPPLEAVR